MLRSLRQPCSTCRNMIQQCCTQHVASVWPGLYWALREGDIRRLTEDGLAKVLSTPICQVCPSEKWRTHNHPKVSRQRPSTSGSRRLCVLLWQPSSHWPGLARRPLGTWCSVCAAVERDPAASASRRAPPEIVGHCRKSYVPSSASRACHVVGLWYPSCKSRNSEPLRKSLHVRSYTVGTCLNRAS